MKWSNDSGHRRVVVQPPLFQSIRISENLESEEVPGGPMDHKIPLPRGWKRRVVYGCLKLQAGLHVRALSDARQPLPNES